MTFEFSNHVVKYDMPTLVNCARYGVPIPDDTCVLLGQALTRHYLYIWIKYFPKFTAKSFGYFLSFSAD